VHVSSRRDSTDEVRRLRSLPVRTSPGSNGDWSRRLLVFTPNADISDSRILTVSSDRSHSPPNYCKVGNDQTSLYVQVYLQHSSIHQYFKYRVLQAYIGATDRHGAYSCH